MTKARQGAVLTLVRSILWSKMAEKSVNMSLRPGAEEDQLLQMMGGLVPRPKTTAGTKSDTSVVVKERVKVQRPPLYGVILLNDDYTPMEFVVMILEKHFNKDHEGATQIMLKVHTEGRALCGIYPYEIAETKVTLVTQEAQRDGHPLQCVLERT